jgi:hypothetical protein
VRTPIHGLPPSANARIADFSLRVILAQPLDYAGLVAGSLLHYLEPGHHIGFEDYPVVKWQFPSAPLTWGPHKYSGPIRPNRHPRHWGTTPGPYITRMAGQPRIDPAMSRLLHDYQRYGYAGGQVLAPCLLFALFAIVRRRGPWRLRLDAALLVACALGALFMAAALSVFDYRYALSGDFLLPAAAALAGAAWRSSAAPASAAAGGSRTTAISP